MDVTTHQVSESEAQTAYKEYRDACKKHPDDEWLDTMRLLYKHMRKGHAIIDAAKVIADIGLDDKGMPRLAISRADLDIVHCRHRREGWSNQQIGFTFFIPGRWGYTVKAATVRVDYPSITDDEAVKFGWSNGKRPNGTRWVTDELIMQTVVPKIPAALRPTHKLINYHILWEVDEWKPTTPSRSPGDPLLLKHIKGSMFAVLAAWDLTELERTVIAGLLQNRN